MPKSQRFIIYILLLFCYDIRIETAGDVCYAESGSYNR